MTRKDQAESCSLSPYQQVFYIQGCQLQPNDKKENFGGCSFSRNSIGAVRKVVPADILCCDFADFFTEANCVPSFGSCALWAHS